MNDLLKKAASVFFVFLPGVIRKVRHDKLTFLAEYPLYEIYSTIRHIERKKVPGILIEAGVALGGSAIVMAAAKNRWRPLFLYDVFDMIPPPTIEDGEDVAKRYSIIKTGDATGIGGETYYGYQQNLLDRVHDTFVKYNYDPAPHSVHLIKGLFTDTLRVDSPVAFAHLDGDWYESTLVCLQQIWQHVSAGGRIIIDDYYHWSGCKKAVDEFFKGRDDFKFLKHSRLHVLKTPVLASR